MKRGFMMHGLVKMNIQLAINAL